MPLPRACLAAAALTAVVGSGVFLAPAARAATRPTPAPGDLFYADNGSRVVRLYPGDGSASSTIAYAPASTFKGPSDVAVDTTGDVFVADSILQKVFEVAPDGTTRTVGGPFNGPGWVEVDRAGNVYVVDSFAYPHSLLYKIAPDGTQTTLDANFVRSIGLAPDGDVLAVEEDQVVDISPGGARTVLFTFDDNDPTYSYIEAVAEDTSGNLYLSGNGHGADTPGVIIPGPATKVAPDGTVTHFGSFSNGAGMALDAAGNVYTTDCVQDADSNNTCTLEEFHPDGTQTVRPTPGQTGNGDFDLVALPPTLTASTPPAAGTQGTAYAGYTYSATSPATEPAATFAVHSGALPPGLTLNATTGRLSGTPTAAGTFTFTVQAANAAAAAYATATVTVASPVTVSSIAPTSGPPAGGTPVVLHGKGFTGATKVVFGGLAAKSFTVDSDTQITAVSPAESPSQHYVYVSTPTATSLASAANLYTFAGTGIASLSPASGPKGGGTAVVIRGSGLTGATKVVFGGVAAKSFTVKSDTEIDAVSPAESPSSHYVYVTTPQGTSAGTAASLFTFRGPVFTAISPASGPSAGGTTVTITGSGFTGATQVLFGSVPAPAFTVVSDTKISAVTPKEPPASHNTFVVTPDGTSDQVTGDAFTFTSP